MGKITRYQDIPSLMESGNYEVDQPTIQSAVEFVSEMERELGLIVQPDFQRHHVWSETQQIAWLEFFFAGGTTGRTLYFNHTNWKSNLNSGEFVLVDGLQRLTAMRRFVGNEIPVYGSYAREFTDRPFVLAARNTIKININDLPTRADVLKWYLEMNGGGTPHTKEELDRVRKLLKKESGK